MQDIIYDYSWFNKSTKRKCKVYADVTKYNKEATHFINFPNLSFSNYLWIFFTKYCQFKWFHLITFELKQI